MEPVRQCAAVILTDKQNRVLLWQPRQSYGLPGGVVEPGETPPQAAVREAEEEIGVVVALEYLVGSYHLRGGGKVDNFEFIYKARIVSGKPRIADPNEVERLEWFEPDKLPRPGLMLNVMRVAIPDFWTGERGVIRHVQRLQAEFRRADKAHSPRNYVTVIMSIYAGCGFSTLLKLITSGVSSTSASSL